MIGVSRLVGDPDRHQRNDGRDQIKRGVQGFRKNAQAAGGDADNDFQRGNGESGQHGVPCHRALLGAHGLGTVNCRRSRHSGIIAMEPLSNRGRVTVCLLCAVREMV